MGALSPEVLISACPTRSISARDIASLSAAAVASSPTAYALDRDSRKAALARFLKRASGGESERGEEYRRLAA